MDTILVVNAGSSSVKFQVFGIGGRRASLTPLVKGQMDGIGTRPRLRASGPAATTLIDQTLSTRARSPDVPAAIADGRRLAARELEVMLARGRPSRRARRPGLRPARSDRRRRCWQRLERYVPLAPLHQPNNLAPIRAISQRAARICRRSPASTRLSIAATMRVADHYAIPERFYAEGVRRYGFHGLSYEYIAGGCSRSRRRSPTDA